MSFGRQRLYAPLPNSKLPVLWMQSATRALCSQTTYINPNQFYKLGQICASELLIFSFPSNIFFYFHISRNSRTPKKFWICSIWLIHTVNQDSTQKCHSLEDEAYRKSMKTYNFSPSRYVVFKLCDLWVSSTFLIICQRLDIS